MTSSHTPSPTARTTPRRRTHRARRRAVATSLLAGAILPGLLASSAPAGAEPVSAAERFVRQGYLDVLLDADPDPAAIEAAAARLQAGESQAVWLWNLLQSSEGRTAFVEAEFERLLGRPADPSGLAHYVGRMERGATRQNIRAFLVGSSEYRARQGGTDAAFVDAAFRDLLGRPADPSGRAYWLRQLETGTTRTRVAELFQASSEGRRVRVRLIFASYLDRAPDPSGLAYWVGRLQRDSEERVITTIAGGSEYARLAARAPAAERVLLLSAEGDLIVKAPGQPDASVPVVGLAEGTDLVAIDVRPATGVLYGLGSNGQLYAISTATGTADAVGAPIPDFDAAGGVGFDFNPVPDALRVIAGDRNYRLNATTGEVLGEGPAGSGTPGPLTYAPGDVNEGEVPEAFAAAYTNSTRGLPLPTETALFDLDAGTDSLVRQNPANAGTLMTVGSLRLDATEVGGFDVSPDGTQAAYAVLRTERGQGLYAIDLRTGEPKLLERLTGPAIVGLAVVGAEPVVPTEALLGVSSDGLELLTFTSTDATVTEAKGFEGLTAETSIVAIDVRPSNGQLYALGSDGQLYTVDTSMAAVAPLSPLGEAGPVIVGDGVDLLAGVGFDFNPAADALRIVAGDRNFRVNATTGAVVGEGPGGSGTAGSLQYVAGDPGAGTTPDASGAAYTNSYRSATLPTSTALFDIEVARGALVRQNPANAGDLTTVGPLGVAVEGQDGFDISGGPGQTAYAALVVDGAPGLYRIDLRTGAAERVGDLPTGLRGLAVR